MRAFLMFLVVAALFLSGCAAKEQKDVTPETYREESISVPETGLVPGQGTSMADQVYNIIVPEQGEYLSRTEDNVLRRVSRAIFEVETTMQQLYFPSEEDKKRVVQCIFDDGSVLYFIGIPAQESKALILERVCIEIE